MNKKEIYRIVEPPSIVISMLLASNVPLLAISLLGIADLTLLEIFSPLLLALIILFSMSLGLFVYYVIRRIFVDN